MSSLSFAANTRRCFAIVVWCWLAAGVVEAQFGLVTREEALAAVFPNATVDAERVFLTDAQAERIEKLARGELDSKLYARYIATKNGSVVGRAYVETHRVRTKKESLIVSLDPAGRVRRIDVTAFLEPPEYIAGPSWMAQFYDRPLDNDLALQRAIRPIAGATLTAQAVTRALRRVMAIDQVLSSTGELGR
jgi:electron transport complex protein RnfG